ncbi:hypothetical protein LVD17_27160 [Fulvivirga ulvae]|uniref:hypothetical protein n=1 Tax=Fulvivirga ulvae TaxID=2904245 RepID=UPI001F278FB0|nr:hypothetical protein [Fulvivirga ulvae]UII31971.1 hypothetical protein LVD17_27160 [Fulvivirga ulvae]
MADHDAEEAFYNKYWSKIPGVKKNLVSGEISGNRKFVGGTDLKDYNLPVNLNGWIQDGKDGVAVYLNLAGSPDATISGYWHTDNLSSTISDIRFEGGPSIILRAGTVDVFFAAFKSVASKDAFRDKYYTQRYHQRFESFKRAYKNYIGN